MAEFRESENPAVSPRRQAERVELDAGAAQWLAALPQRLQPRETAARFPHILNKLASLWSLPHSCRLYFDDLLMDHRGDRRGFPLKVASEIVGLKDHYDSVVHPTPQSLWDEISTRSRA
jgi:hypothetical protein